MTSPLLFVLRPLCLLGRGSSPYFCHEAMAEFVELLFLPLTTALENLKARHLPPLFFWLCVPYGGQSGLILPLLIKC